MRRAAEHFQCLPATAKRWVDRARQGLPMTDQSSRPRSSPNRCSSRLERRFVALRFTRRWVPHRISYHLGVPRSTVGRVLARYRMPLLHHLDQGTVLPVRKPNPFATSRPGRASSSTSISRSSGASRTVVGTGFSVGPLHRRGIAAAATRSCITPSMTIPDWPTRRSSTTSAKRPLPASGSEPTRSSPPPESR